MGLVDDLAETVYDTVDGVKEYLASDEGRDVRRKVATGLIFAAPVIARLPVMRASPLGRIVGLAGGAAIIVKAAEMLRDWEPAPARVTAPD